VLFVKDSAQQTVYFRNAVASPNRSFSYDALYRLKSAQGRERAHIQPVDGRPADPNLEDLPATNDLMAVVPYTERYQYDLAGNLTFLDHACGEGSWAVDTTLHHLPIASPGCEIETETRCQVGMPMTIRGLLKRLAGRRS